METLNQLLNLGIIDQQTYNIIKAQINSADYKGDVEQRVYQVFQRYFGLQQASLADGIEGLEEVDSTFIVNEIQSIATEKLLFTLKSDLETFNAINEDVRDYVRTIYAEEWIPVIDNHTRSLLVPIFDDWLQGNLGGRGFQDLVSSTNQIFGVERGRRIAVTETTRIFAEVSDATAQETKRSLKWLTSKDDIVSRICRGLDGLVVPYNKSREFKHRETGIKYDCPAHVNCRCEKVIQ
jgi:SPP1 gp7 family putative phage head morphogenesis protein